MKIIIYAEEMFSAVEKRLFVHRRVYRGTCNRERERERGVHLSDRGIKRTVGARRHIKDISSCVLP